MTRAPAERTTPDALGRAFVAAKKSVPALTTLQNDSNALVKRNAKTALDAVEKRK